MKKRDLKNRSIDQFFDAAVKSNEPQNIEGIITQIKDNIYTIENNTGDIVDVTFSEDDWTAPELSKLNQNDYVELQVIKRLRIKKNLFAIAINHIYRPGTTEYNEKISKETQKE